MSKPTKKKPAPKPCERWGIYSKGGRFLFMVTSCDGANFVAVKAKGEFVHRVRIVPVTETKRRK